MTLNLDLSPNLEHELCTEASQLNEYILRVLATRQVSESLPKTGAELVAYWQREGVINSRPDIADSQAHG